MIDIHLLRTFVAAFEEESFTKAARRLHATQPGVSVQIAALELHVGTPLFHRNARSVTPTVAGRHLYPRALRLIQDLNRAAQEIRALAGAAAGRVAIGVPATIAPNVIPGVLSRYLEAYPHCEVHIEEGPVASLIAQIERGALDIALVTQSTDQNALATERLCHDRIIAAVRARPGIDPRASERFLRTQQLQIVVPSMLHQALAGVLDQTFGSGRIVAERVLVLDSVACALELVAETDWMALLPSSAAASAAKRPDVMLLDLPGEAITVEYQVAYARTDAPSREARALVELLGAELGRISALWSATDGGCIGAERSSKRAAHGSRRGAWSATTAAHLVA